MQALSSALPAITKVANVGSGAFNLYNQYRNQQYQSKLRDIASNPAKMNAYASQFIRPLNAGLTKSVGNQAQAYLGERGLSDSPQISEDVLAQAIAPYIQQNQQLGFNEALNALGLGGGAINPAVQQQQGQGALAQLFSAFSPQPKAVDPYSWADLMTSGATPTVDLSSIYEPDYSQTMQGQ